MGIARMLVVTGPDEGTVFAVPLRGGTLGRDDDSIVRLSDPSVSRQHATLELKDGELTIVDHGSRNRTKLNGTPIEGRTLLRDGDTLEVGKTTLRVERPSSIEVVRQTPTRITVEVGSRALLRSGDGGDRAARYLAAVAEFGDRSAALASDKDLGRAACEAALSALAADRAFLILREDGRMVPRAAAMGRDGDSSLSLPQEVIDTVMGQGNAIAAEEVALAGERRSALAAPLIAPGGDGPFGLLYVDRAKGAWEEIDVSAVACLTHLLSAALASLQVREQLVAENRELSAKLDGGAFVGDSPAARTVLAFVDKVGPSDATVLLTGESGSGKEMVARSVHERSRRAGGAFVAVNCAALTETLIESELFGHEKGAFTGATERKIGRFEAADRGTLFLDEVGELPLACQTKFLRVLEERCFERVGGAQPIRVDVRVLAATNRNLAQMVSAGTFRDDLYYRLSVIHTVVPPLRERPSDIPILAEHFFERLRTQVPRRLRGLSDEAITALRAYHWPGNVRELRNAIERAIVLGDSERIEAADLPPEMAGGARAAQPAPPPGPAVLQVPAPAPALAAPGVPENAPRSLKDLEREGIVRALEATGGNKAQAAAILEIDRSTLYKKLKDYGIDR